MQREQISGRQLFFILFLAFSGSVITAGGGGAAGRDIWIAMLGAAVAALPLYLIYVALGRLSEEPLGFFEAALGNKAGKAFCLLYAVFAVHTLSMVVGMFSGFLSAVALPKSPPMLVNGLILLTIIYMARCGTEAVGRFSEVAFPAVVVLLTLSLLAALNKGDLGALLPILQTKLTGILHTGFNSMMIAFGQGFFAIMVLTPCVKKGVCRKSALAAIIFTAIFLCLTFIRNIALLGFPPASEYYFPTYTASSLITLGTFFQRLEIFISAAFLMCELVKSVFILLFAKYALERVFPQCNRIAFTPLASFALLLILSQFSGFIDMLQWLRIYAYYQAIPLLALPPILLAVAWVRKKRKGAQALRPKPPKNRKPVLGDFDGAGVS